MIQKVCIFVFKKTMRGYEFLLLRRPKEHGDMWQPITGHLEKGEENLDAAKREVLEETGVKDIIRIVDPEKSFEFTSKSKKKYIEAVFGFEVSGAIDEIQLSDEHRSYSWANHDTALALLYWDNNKEALILISDKIK